MKSLSVFICILMILQPVTFVSADVESGCSYEEKFDGQYSYSSLPDGFAVNYPTITETAFSISSGSGYDSGCLSVKKVSDATDKTFVMTKSGMKDITGSSNVFQVKVRCDVDTTISSTDALGDWIQPISLEYTGGTSNIKVIPLLFTAYNAQIRTLVTGTTYNTSTNLYLAKGEWYTLTYASILDENSMHHFEAYLNRVKIGETEPLQDESGNLDVIAFELHRALSKGQMCSFDDLKVYQAE